MKAYAKQKVPPPYGEHLQDALKVLLDGGRFRIEYKGRSYDIIVTETPQIVDLQSNIMLSPTEQRKIYVGSFGIDDYGFLNAFSGKMEERKKAQSLYNDRLREKRKRDDKRINDLFSLLLKSGFSFREIISGGLDMQRVYGFVVGNRPLSRKYKDPEDIRSDMEAIAKKIREAIEEGKVFK